jgi:uncharacterized protein
MVDRVAVPGESRVVLVAEVQGRWARYNRSVSTPTRITVHVQPRASRTEVAGMHDGCIKIRVSAPPVEGAANSAVIELFARTLKVAKSRVRVVSGATGRRKVIEVDGVAGDVVAAALLKA